MKYIISQRNNLYTEDNKIYYNGKMIEYEGDFEEAVLNKKVEIYRSFLSRHFDNTIVLTGAGSSFGIGKTEIKGMTMKKLWGEIVNKCGKESIEKLGKKINYKIDDITRANLEEFLSHASLYLLLYHDTDSEVKENVNKIKQIIISNCTIIMPEDAPHKEFLKRITARKLKHNRLKLFTTNYDMLFEQAANECGFTMIDGFTFTFPRVFNGNNYDYDIVIRKNSRITAQENYAGKVFHLYKLHGSLDWEKDEESGQIRKCDFANNKMPVMIFPSSIKYETSYEQPFFEMMSRFQTELRMDNALLIIIGYSFGDKHINSMIFEALELNHSLQLVIVDPYIENFEEIIKRTERSANIMLIKCDFNELALNYPYSYAYGQEEMGEE
jgi:NAD-dependent SIR2 family protein deacetylase